MALPVGFHASACVNKKPLFVRILPVIVSVSCRFIVPELTDAPVAAVVLSTMLLPISEPLFVIAAPVAVAVNVIESVPELVNDETVPLLINVLPEMVPSAVTVQPADIVVIPVDEIVQLALSIVPFRVVLPVVFKLRLATLDVFKMTFPVCCKNTVGPLELTVRVRAFV